MEYRPQIDKLVGQADWSRWKRQVTLLLQHQNVFGVVNGTIRKPGEQATAAEKKSFFQKDSLAQLVFSTTMDEKNLELTTTCESAQEVWDKLLSVYELSSGQKLDRLLEVFFQESYNGDEMSSHIGKLEKHFRELNEELFKFSNQRLPDIILMSRILSTLPSEYFEFKSVWESVPMEERSVSKLTERVRLIEMRLPTSASTSETALTVEKKTSKPTKIPHTQSGKKFFKCFTCGKIGHFSSQCPENKNKRKETRGQAHDAEGTVFNCEKLEHLDDTWIADTGASHHMTKNANYFVKYSKFDHPKQVKVGNAEVIEAYGSGTINVTMTVNGMMSRNHLANVWFVPKLGRNLLSIGQTVEHGYEFIVKGGTCAFTKNGQAVLCGRKRNGLYELDMNTVVPFVPASVYIASSQNLQLWHEKMCHQDKRHVKRYLDALGVKIEKDAENIECKGCILGKQHRRSFHKRVRPSQPGELISADVCGPMQTTSVGGAKYFVCFKDSYTRFRRVFILKSKAEVARSLSTFLAECDSAGHRVREFLSDGGREFDNSEVRTLLESRGINFQIVMP